MAKKDTFEYNKDEPLRPVQKSISGIRMVAIAGTGLFEINKQKDKEEEERKTEDNKNLKAINKALKEGNKKGGKGGKSKDGDDTKSSKVGAFTGSLAGSAKDTVKDAMQPLVDTLNPMTYLKMLGTLPGVGAVGDAIAEARKIKSSEDKKEDKEDDKVEEKQTDTGYKILENDEDNKNSLDSMDNDFDKLLNLTETIKETLSVIRDQGADSKLLDKENKNEQKRMMAGIGVGAGVGAGVGTGDGKDDGGSDTGNPIYDTAKNAINSNWLTNLLLGGGILKSVAKRIPGVNLLLKGGGKLKNLLGKGVGGIKNLLGKGVGGIKNLLGKGVGGLGTGLKNLLGKGVGGIKNLLGKGVGGIKNLVGLGGQASNLPKAQQAGLALRNLGSKSKNLLKARHLLKAKTLAQLSNPIGWATLAGEVGVESWIRQTEAHTKGLEESLGQEFEMRDGKKYDKKTGIEIDDKTALDNRIKDLGLDPEGEKAGKLRRRTRGFNALKVNEQMISDAVGEALELRKSGEDQEANAKMQAAVELINARRNIISNMGFDDFKEAKKAYTLNYSDIGRKIAALGGTQGKWNMFEMEDRGHFRDLDKAFSNIELDATRVSFEATDKTARISESRNKQVIMTPDGPIRISSAPNTSGAILSETNTELQNNQSGLNSGKNGQLAINAPTNSTTNNTTNNIANNKGDSRMNESAFNAERRESRGSDFM